MVCERESFVRRLAEGQDVILSDFSMPSFGGMEALKIARDMAPYVPFIFLSGTIGEERAVEGLRSGAADYVIKDRPQRLIPAIRRALKDARLAAERREADEQMRRVQRLENIGMLAAGIAHDFNNVLAPVIMGISILRDRHPAESDRKIMATIEASAMRGAGLVKQILGFAHGSTGEAQLIQPRHLIVELAGMMEQTFPKVIGIELEIARELWPVRINPTQFHQVILNLCVNARDAMPKGGALTLRARNHSVDAQSAVTMPEIQEGPHLLIEVSDTGTGIPPEIVEKIWQPFFTTKEENKGTGLGLSTVRGIINEHKGVITLQTEPGQGTSFRILLPAVPNKEAPLDPVAMSALPRGQGELVLVVDHDSAVRETTAALLTDQGYNVLSASDGTEAVALFAPRSLDVRVVVTDLDMPNLDGAALAKIVRALNPYVRVILVSGSAEMRDPRLSSTTADLLLQKPFGGDVLLRSLHELLGGRKP
ncbi:hypothetical protein MASR2M8_13940 [Opitutaceae bacterium]